MTTGLKYQLDDKGRVTQYRQWTGSDGRKTASGLSKYNAYTCQVHEQSFDDNTSENLTTTAQRDVKILLGDNDQLSLLSKLQEQVRGHSFNAGIFLATGGQTIDLALDFLSKTYRCFRALKHGDLAEAARYFGMSSRSRNTRPLNTADVSSAWLELQYGWKPLLSDIHEAGKAWQQANRSSGSVLVSNVQKSLSQPFSEVVDSTFSGAERSGTYFHKRRIICRYTSSSFAVHEIGLCDPLSIAWELLPWSFVADWFIPIGTYLDVINQMPIFDGAEFCTTDYYYVVSKTRAWGRKIEYSPPPIHLGPKYYASATYRGGQVNRAVSSSIQVPRPSFKSADVALSKGHIENAIALIHGLTFSR